MTHLLPAYITSGSQWAIWCPRCGHLHYHGSLPGHRSPHCTLPPARGEILKGYFLIPVGRPLPEGAKRLDRLGRRRIDRLLYAKKPTWTPPQPVPEWGRPIEDRDYALSLLAVWVYEEVGKRGEAFQEAMAHWSETLPDPSSGSD